MTEIIDGITSSEGIIDGVDKARLGELILDGIDQDIAVGDYEIDFRSGTRPIAGHDILGDGTTTLNRNSNEYNFNGSALELLIDDEVRISYDLGAGFSPAVANLIPFKDFDNTYDVNVTGDSSDIRYNASDSKYRVQVNSGAGGAATTTLDSDSVRSAASARAIKIAISGAGVSAADVYFTTISGQMPLYVTNGTDYTVSFYAWASTSKTIPVFLKQSGASSQNISVTTAKTEFELTYTATSTVTNGAIQLDLGDNGLYDFYIDAIMFQESSFASSRWIGGDAAVGSEKVADGVFEEVTLGSELHTDDNAAADSGGEVNATTGWIQFGLDVGANVFESQGAVKNVGDYALHANADNTPTGGARFFKDIGTDFSLTIGKTYRLTFDWRHIGGAGDIWSARFASSTQLGADISEVDAVGNSDVTFNTLSYDFTYNANYRYFGFREDSATNNNGGVYVDNLSVKPAPFTSYNDDAANVGPGTDGSGNLTNKLAFSNATTSDVTQSGTTATAKTVYRIDYVVEQSAGSVQLEFGSTNGTSRSAAGTYHDYMIAADTDFLKIKGTGFTGTVDTLSIKTHGSVGVSESAQLSYTLPTSPTGGELFAETLDTETLSNIGFETAGTGGTDVFANWSETASDGTIASEAGSVHGGSAACKLTQGASTGTQISQVAVGSPSANTLYKISFWTRGSGAVAGRFSIGGMTPNIGTQTTGITGDTYTQVVIYGIANGAPISVTLKPGGVNGNIAYFDDVSVKQVTNAYDSGSGLLPPHGVMMLWFRMGMDGNVGTDNSALLTLQDNVSSIARIRQKAANEDIIATDGTTAIGTIFTRNADTLYKYIYKWGYLSSNVLKQAVSYDSGSGIQVWTEGNFDGAHPTGTDLILAHTPFGPIWIQKITIDSRIMSDDEIDIRGF